MSVVIEITNTANLKKAKSLLGAKSNVETLELALEKVIEDYEPKIEESKKGELSDEYWDELFSQPKLPSSVVINAFSEEREDRF